MNTPCPECGQIHDLPFSHRLLKLYQQFSEAETKEARLALIQEISAQFVAEHDITDININDDYHEYFEEYAAAKLSFEQAQTKLARVAVHVLDEYVTSNEINIDTMTAANTTTTN